MVAILLVLGCFMDQISMMLLTFPFFLPLANAFNMDLVWLGVILLISLQIGLLTPPFGLLLFVMKGVAPPEITMRQVWAAAPNGDRLRRVDARRVRAIRRHVAYGRHAMTKPAAIEAARFWRQAGRRIRRCRAFQMCGRSTTPTPCKLRPGLWDDAVVGRKVGCSSEQSQRLVNSPGPIAGMLFGDALWHSPPPSRRPVSSSSVSSGVRVSPRRRPAGTSGAL